MKQAIKKAKFLTIINALSSLLAAAAPPTDGTLRDLERSNSPTFATTEAIGQQGAPRSIQQRFPVETPFPPGRGPKDRILFPPTCGSKNVWPIFYLDEKGELLFAFPMSQGIWATGDWFDLRHTLLKNGVNIIGSYVSDFQGNISGGESQGFAYADSIDIRLDLEMQKLVGWRGARLVFSCVDRNGSNLSEQHVGNELIVSQLWGVETISYYALWLEQNLFNDQWQIKIGRVTVMDDFAFSPIYGLYINGGISDQPSAYPVSGYLSAYPSAVWGGRVRFDNKEHKLYTMVGIYQTTNRLYSPIYHGVDFSIRRNDGINLIWEIGWDPEFQPHPLPKNNSNKAISSSTLEEWLGMPGNYKFGAYYTPWRNIPQFIPTKNTFYAYGFYWLLEQMVYQAVPGTDRGLTLWTTYIYSPQQNTSKLPFQAIAGVVYTGLIPGRHHDQLMLAWIYGTFSENYASAERAQSGGYPTYEMVLEVSYRVNLSAFFYVQPDIQYVIRPGGTGQIPNALVVGVQIGCNF